MCDHDCLNCKKPDCDNDIITAGEARKSQSMDFAIKRERAYTSRQKTQLKYNQSEKGKASRERYRKSEKGRENEKRKRKRRIENGKNAESCRAYYYRKKAERGMKEGV